MSNPENSRYPLPVHSELSKPPGILRPGFEIAAAKNIIETDLTHIKGRKELQGVTISWIDRLTDPKWKNVPEIIKEGFKSSKEISRRDGLHYALGGTPDRFFSHMPDVIGTEIDNVDKDQTTRPLEEVKKAYNAASENVASSLELQVASESLRLYSIDLQNRGYDGDHTSKDLFTKLGILLLIEQRIGRFEALEYVLGKENVIGKYIKGGGEQK